MDEGTWQRPRGKKSPITISKNELINRVEIYTRKITLLAVLSCRIVKNTY